MPSDNVWTPEVRFAMWSSSMWGKRSFASDHLLIGSPAFCTSGFPKVEMHHCSGYLMSQTLGCTGISCSAFGWPDAADLINCQVFAFSKDIKIHQNSSWVILFMPKCRNFQNWFFSTCFLSPKMSQGSVSFCPTSTSNRGVFGSRGTPKAEINCPGSWAATGPSSHETGATTAAPQQQFVVCELWGKKKKTGFEVKCDLWHKIVANLFLPEMFTDVWAWPRHRLRWTRRFSAQMSTWNGGGWSRGELWGLSGPHGHCTSALLYFVAGTAVLVLENPLANQCKTRIYIYYDVLWYQNISNAVIVANDLKKKTWYYWYFGTWYYCPAPGCFNFLPRLRQSMIKSSSSNLSDGDPSPTPSMSGSGRALEDSCLNTRYTADSPKLTYARNSWGSHSLELHHP